MSLFKPKTAEEGKWQYCNYGFNKDLFTSFDDCMNRYDEVMSKRDSFNDQAMAARVFQLSDKLEPQTQADCPEGTKFKPRGCKPPQKCTNNRNTCEGTPLSPITAKTMGVGSNWLVPALLIGAGIFILTRKSE